MIPNDRGTVFIKKNADGTKNVYVAMGVDAAGMPEDVFAVYRDRREVLVDPAIEMVSAGSMARTRDPVCVVNGSAGVVRVMRRRRDPGPLFRD